MSADQTAHSESADLRSAEEASALMSVPGRSLGADVSSLSADGPGNKAIAATLLEWLSVQGRFAERERALRALGEGAAEVFAHSEKWLAEGAIESLFAAGGVDAGLARALGHRLVEPDATGLRLYGLGLATPEKAYRRVQSLLPRDSRAGRWNVEEIEGQGARLRYRPNALASPGAASTAESLCALRRGMLEAIPGLHGLLPAEVEETACVARGDDACCYVVRWQTTSRTGLFAGLISGAACALGLMASHAWVGRSLVADASGAGLSATFLGAVAALVAGPSLGAFWDARRQLAAVAGTRRGQLALFDQVDDALAEKLDALARAEEKTEPVSAGPASSRLVEADSGAARSHDDEGAILHAAHQIHTAAGDLACWFESGAWREPGDGEEIEQWGLVRDIREWAARIAELGAGEARGIPRSVDLVRLVERAVASARPGLTAAAIVEVEADSDLPPLECEPVQIEHVVVQLLRNAVEASVELSQTPKVRIVLSKAPHGLEMAVEDRGVGIESAQIDEVFDPFFGGRSPGAAGGLGLAVCLRIIERHGGELRIENQARAGTRVTVVLPTKGASPRSGEPFHSTSSKSEEDEA